MMDAPELRKRNLLKKYLLGDAAFFAAFFNMYDIDAARKNELGRLTYAAIRAPRMLYIQYFKIKRFTRVTNHPPL